MGCTMRMDFEGDQWTFLKPPPEDLERLFGIDVHEMQPYRPLPEQIAAQLARGRTLIVELDSFYLPDTAATSYRSEHVKSSIVAEAIDPGGERLRYFHATALHELEGEDYAEFSVWGARSPRTYCRHTPSSCASTRVRACGRELRDAARGLLRHHLEHRPATNPFARFGAQLERDLPRLLDGEAADYHAYAFATVRMAGSAFEVAASHVDWLLGDAGAPACRALTKIVEAARRCLSGSPVAGRSSPSRRLRDSPRPGRGTGQAR